MKIIKITEKQDKLLKEMEVMQYQGDSADMRHFFSELNGNEIDWDSKNVKLNDADLNDASKINIEWSCAFAFKENGFSFNPKIDRIYGELVFSKYDWDNSKTNIIGKITVDSKNGWKIELPSYGMESDSNKLIFPKNTGSIEVLIDSKTIRIMN